MNNHGQNDSDLESNSSKHIETTMTKHLDRLLPDSISIRVRFPKMLKEEPEIGVLLPDFVLHICKLPVGEEEGGPGGGCRFGHLEDCVKNSLLVVCISNMESGN